MLYEMNHFHKASTLIVKGSQGHKSVNFVLYTVQESNIFQIKQQIE